MAVAENVTFGPRMRGVAAAEAQARAEKALATVQLSGMADRYPRQLSGGQQQRVALARCLVVEDSVSGILGGVAAGMTVLGFHGGDQCF